ncbi:unnamed protein product [Spodoptera littoralis]|uniref:Uncharacterized protein n=1 Tax=Spodoptera littoralis TaxID=7109 RepID=A0A9P0N2T7_SPOLI|nr:unnamed protein product [Spodoptera littoralis]CAH1639458.1 unnamed protein product [Spodoptera littoralis]
MARSVALLLLLCSSIVSTLATPWTFYNIPSFTHRPQHHNIQLTGTEDSYTAGSDVSPSISITVAAPTISSIVIKDNAQQTNIGNGGAAYGNGNAGNGGNFENINIEGIKDNADTVPSDGGTPDDVFNLGNGGNSYGGGDGENGDNFSNITITG